MELPIRVYIEDTDAGGIVYYVNYLKFFERARTEFMRKVGFDRAAIFNANMMFVVNRVEVDYKVPAKLDDELIATAEVVEVGAARLVFAQSLYNGEIILASGQIQVASVKRDTLKPQRLPKVMRDRLSIPME